MTWQQILTVVAASLLWNVGRDLIRAWRRQGKTATTLPEVLAVGNGVGDPDTGELWQVTHVSLDAYSGDEPRLTVDLIRRRPPRTTDREGA